MASTTRRFSYRQDWVDFSRHWRASLYRCAPADRFNTIQKARGCRHSYLWWHTSVTLHRMDHQRRVGLSLYFRKEDCRKERHRGLHAGGDGLRHLICGCAYLFPAIVFRALNHVWSAGGAEVPLAVPPSRFCDFGVAFGPRLSHLRVLSAHTPVQCQRSDHRGLPRAGPGGPTSSVDLAITPLSSESPCITRRHSDAACSNDRRLPPLRLPL